MRARSPKHPFSCDSRVPFQELIYWRFRSNWRFRSISIACQPFRSPFRSFRAISIYFDLFRSISISSIYFDPFRFWHRNCQNISIGCRPFRSVSIQDQNRQNKTSQASCTLSTWSHARQPFVIPAPSSKMNLVSTTRSRFSCSSLSQVPRRRADLLSALSFLLFISFFFSVHPVTVSQV